MQETGRVIAAAAVIMLCVFASFGFSGQRVIAQTGIGLAVGVLVDAFLLRMTVIPALMHLIGRRNWAYPRWADRITPWAARGSHANEERPPALQDVGSDLRRAAVQAQSSRHASANADQMWSCRIRGCNV
jgi:RND superfamily putative drug exporter